METSEYQRREWGLNGTPLVLLFPDAMLPVATHLSRFAYAADLPKILAHGYKRKTSGGLVPCSST